jgi:hypothetical protein
MGLAQPSMLCEFELLHTNFRSLERVQKPFVCAHLVRTNASASFASVETAPMSSSTVAAVVLMGLCGWGGAEGTCGHMQHTQTAAWPRVVQGVTCDCTVQHVTNQQLTGLR